jgi:hypothetical protein
VSATLQHLLALDDAEVKRLLTLRPDTLFEPAPRDLRELAERLDSPDSVSAVLHTAPLPALQLAEALLALQLLHGPARRSDVITFVASQEPDAAVVEAVEAVDRMLSWLADRLLVTATQVGDEVLLHGCDGLQACFDEPLGLDRPAAELHAAQTARTLHDILSRLGAPRPGSKAEAVNALVRVLTDPDEVRAIVSAGPPDVATWLDRACRQGAGPGRAEGSDRALGGTCDGPVAADAQAHDELGQGPFGSLYDPVAAQRELAAATWAAQHGLVVGVGWGGAARVPAEVALAVRGPAYRAPFTPDPPAVPTRPVALVDVERQSAAAASAFAEHAVALLDLVERSPLPTVKAGGVGARELGRVAKAMGAGSAEVRLALECAGDSGLLFQDAAGVRTSADFAAWRQHEPAHRLATLLEAWWRLGGPATVDRDDAGRPIPALAGRLACPLCSAARHTLLTALRDLPPGRSADLQTVALRALWCAPLVHAWSPGVDTPFASAWLEAELLGVVARGALSPLGRLLVNGDDLEGAAATLLPSTTEEAVFGSDLTVVAAGSPSAQVTSVLDAVADREGRGGAVVWRITPGSIRRALDAGASPADLERDLTAIARGDLPQPLRYLLQDVGRRHGALRVRRVASCVRSDDTALLAQVAADRSLRRLGLRLLAPTVLASAVDATATVEALRAAGYLPVAEDVDGVVLVAAGAPPTSVASSPQASSGRRRAARPEAEGHSAGGTSWPDVAVLALELVKAGDPGPRQPTSLTEARLRAQAPQLPATQARLLGHAIDTGTDVVLDYVAASGARTQRQVSELVLAGGVVSGWCHLRQDERYFSLSGIAVVHPAPST